MLQTKYLTYKKKGKKVKTLLENYSPAKLCFKKSNMTY